MKQIQRKSLHYSAGIALLIAAFLFAAPAALAQEVNPANSDLSGSPGTTPDSAFYGLKTGMENLGLFFTFNQEKKAEKEVVLADKKLLEVKAMAEKGNLKAMQKAQERHDKLLTDAKGRLDKIQADSNPSDVADKIAKVSGLEKAIQVHENKIAVLNDILANENLTEQQRSTIESLVSLMQNKTSDMQDKLADKKDNIKTQLRAVTGKSNNEVENEIDKIDKKTGLYDAEKQNAEYRLEKAQMIFSILKEGKNKTLNNINSPISDEQLSQFDNAIAKAKAFIEAGNYSEAIDALKPFENFVQFVSPNNGQKDKSQLNDKSNGNGDKTNDKISEKDGSVVNKNYGEKEQQQLLSAKVSAKETKLSED